MSRLRALFSQTSVTVSDFLVCALIMALCAIPFFLYQKAPEFLNADVYYVDLAHSLLQDHSYSANFASERLRPPGLSLILALICATLGCTHDLLTRTMPVFFALGLLVSYEVIRRQGGRLIAASSCFLLAASPSIFPWVTSRLWPIFPYFLVTMLAFLVIPKLETSRQRLSTFLEVLLLCFLVTAAVILESAGISLIAALLAWIGLSFFGNRDTARLRLRRFLPIALVALLAEGLWLQQGGNPSDWPLPGYPHGYLSQLSVKEGNHPELGLATPKDILVRVERNLRESTIFLAETLYHRWIDPSWTSPVVAGIAILIACGLWSSLLRSDSQLCALYFIFFEGVYLLWPWFTGVLRFALAVLPLACFYLAEGVVALRRWSRESPRQLGILFLPLSFVLAFVSIRQTYTNGIGHGFQEKISAIFWILCSAVCVSLTWKKSLTVPPQVSRAYELLEARYPAGRLSFRPLQLMAALAVTYLVATGAAAEIPMGRDNLLAGSMLLPNIPEFQAGQWLKSNTDPKAIVAASQDSLLYHYSQRRVIWFPPISNPKTLMDGIREHHIAYVVIVERGFNYYLPPETVCFNLLYAAYPADFHLAETIGPVKIYMVLPDSAVSHTPTIH
jgi:hypothetical protein